MRCNSRGKKRPLTLAQAKQIQAWLISEKRWRDLVIVMVGIDSLLRSVDLRQLGYDDLVDIHGNIRSYLVWGQQKTKAKKAQGSNKRTVEIHLSKPTRIAVAHWIKTSGKGPGDYLFTPLRNRRDIPDNTPISREAMGNIIKTCVSAIGLDPTRYSTKTLRCTRVRPILETAENDYQVPRLLLGHADIRSTIHYCAIDEERALEISKAVQFFDPMPLSIASKVNKIGSDKFDETPKIGRE